MVTKIKKTSHSLYKKFLYGFIFALIANITVHLPFFSDYSNEAPVLINTTSADTPNAVDGTGFDGGCDADPGAGGADCWG